MYRKVVALVLVAIFLMAISLMAGFMCFPNNLLHAHYRSSYDEGMGRRRRRYPGRRRQGRGVGGQQHATGRGGGSEDEDDGRPPELSTNMMRSEAMPVRMAPLKRA
ncbi:hypothetical protein BDA96_10G075400 [Sorghum bicolor]|uniref:Uncharacterized protein n=2 Tax=Sorghum bicolor TaxID=4558 RepID=A0A194YHM2_SORBI|nr:uncharacterized protein LOC110431395 [Sorghum bicolor]KAG0513135.1 hypothetical protein BDA96_10G075400 [Sorghum bicolor]KXG19467.1 hypothetical protein SORBI_3010G063100 [Sorghum bicolor]OQU75962.1 hypothetical protein SORBI_3010G063100 [Sorghum bicolor]|eukprot:XP_021306172.1 uncharacterized protein LOC110431395 [Sorghum bicolor]